MPDQTALLRAFADYARTIARHYEIGEVLYRLTDQAVEVLGIHGAGVSIADGEQLQFVTATDERVTAVEEEQIELADGPCHEAWLTLQQVVVADMEAEERWPRYRAVAIKQDLRAAAGIPMAIGEHKIGALDLYNDEPGEWSRACLDTAQVLADMATGYIVNARTLSAHRELATQLQHALDSRVIIEQAKGVLSGRHSIPTATAFQKLRAHARSNNTKIHEIARAVVDGELEL